MNHLSDGIYDIIVKYRTKSSLEMDIITLDDGGIANGIVKS